MAVQTQRQEACLCSCLLCQDPVLSGTGESLEIPVEHLEAVIWWKAHKTSVLGALGQLQCMKWIERKESLKSGTLAR